MHETLWTESRHNAIILPNEKSMKIRGTKMKSFGLWYLINKHTDDSNENTTETTDIMTSTEHGILKTRKPEFDLHVNFWSLEDYKHIDNECVPCLDIGIKINGYKLLNKLTFFCPFKVEANDIKDLSDKMSTKNNANIIFNTDCEIHTKDNYTIIELEKENLLVFPLNQVIKDVYSLQPDGYGTKLVFEFHNFQKYVNSNSELKKYDMLYIRFRIKGNTLKHNIYFDSEPLNKSFESAFSGTRMIDFKINERRNIEEKVRAEIIVNHEELAILRRVHFLVMEPSAYDVRSFDDQEMNCRELEEGLWDDYFGATIDFSKGHILAYHWKQCKEKEGFNCLVKVNYSKTKAITIFIYAMIVIALGIISSAIVTTITIWKPNSIVAMLFCIIGGGALIGIGILIGKYSK